jgi:hypothetical protein
MQRDFLPHSFLKKSELRLKTLRSPLLCVKINDTY